MQFVAQLNLQRGFNRRKAAVFDCINAGFTNEEFNFTKINDNEILFFLSPGRSTAVGVITEEFFVRKDHAIVINVSPVDDCHVLLVPELENCLPQKITLHSLLLAFDLAQLSGHPGN